jgi:hypothetical protein
LSRNAGLAAVGWSSEVDPNCNRGLLPIPDDGHLPADIPGEVEDDFGEAIEAGETACGPPSIKLTDNNRSEGDGRHHALTEKNIRVATHI